jgi:uncharacterized protein YbjT (DUF2867 family)
MPTTLVIGATGTVGRHLVPQLVRRGLSVRALVRNPAADLPAGVDRAVGDLADPASLIPALDGVDAVYLACGNHRPGRWRSPSTPRRRGRAAHVALHQRRGDRSPAAFADAHGYTRRTCAPVYRPRPARHFHDDQPLAAAEGAQHAGAIFLPGAGAKVAMIDRRTSRNRGRRPH